MPSAVLWTPLNPTEATTEAATVDLTPGRARAVCEDNALCRWFLDMTGNETFAPIVGALVIDIARTALILLVAWVLVRLTRRVIRHLVREMAESSEAGGSALRRKVPMIATTQSTDPRRAVMRTETIGTVLKSLASVTIWSVALLVAVSSLTVVEINLAPLIAGAGILGVALGFGAQSLVKDFLSGMFMLLEDWYGVGDIIDAGPATGVVEGITLRSTRLRDVEGVLWHVPNGEIARVGNLSQQWSRTLLDIPVAYDTSIRHAIDVIKRTADQLWRDPDWQGLILEEPEVWGVEHFADDAMIIRLVLKTVPAEQWAVGRELRLRLKAAFDDADIEIPFPQRTVWMRQHAPDGDHRLDENGFLPPYRSPHVTQYERQQAPADDTGAEVEETP